MTSFTDYGLRMLMLMRMASVPDRAFSNAELAREFALSRNHLIKIIQRLAQGGVVSTRRGAGGGATLARAPQDISLGAVVRLLEDGQALVDCFASNGSTCTITGCCRLKARLYRAEAAFLACLDRSTLAEVALPMASAPPLRFRGLIGINCCGRITQLRISMRAANWHIRKSCNPQGDIPDGQDRFA